jgi:hypothetical protein
MTASFVKEALVVRVRETCVEIICAVPEKEARVGLVRAAHVVGVAPALKVRHPISKLLTEAGLTGRSVGRNRGRGDTRS